MAASCCLDCFVFWLPSPSLSGFLWNHPCLNLRNSFILGMNGGPVVKTLCLKCRVWLASLVAQTVETLPAVQETQLQSLGWEDPLEQGMATHSIAISFFHHFLSHRLEKGVTTRSSVIFSSRKPWTGSLAGYSSWRPKESDRTERITLSVSLWELRSYTLHGMAKRKKKFIHSINVY